MHMPKLDRHWTVDDLRALPDDGNRYEVIDGELFVTPAPIWRHQDAVARLQRLLADYLAREPIGYAYHAPADVEFSSTRLVQPDVFVVPLVHGRRPRAWVDVRMLLLACEVLSPSTARADRVAKRRLFREESVPEYWIIDVDARTIERSTPAESRPEVLTEQLQWWPGGATEPLVIDLASYFAGVLDD